MRIFSLVFVGTALQLAQLAASSRLVMLLNCCVESMLLPLPSEVADPRAALWRMGTPQSQELLQLLSERS